MKLFVFFLVLLTHGCSLIDTAINAPTPLKVLAASTYFYYEERQEILIRLHPDYTTFSNPNGYAAEFSGTVNSGNEISIRGVARKLRWGEQSPQSNEYDVTVTGVVKGNFTVIDDFDKRIIMTGEAK